MDASRLSVKQNECGFNCYSVHALKVPVYKIPFCFTINITELVHQKSFSKDANSSVLVHFLPIMWSHNFSVQLATKVLLERLQVSTDLVQFSSVSTFVLRVPLLSKIELLLYLKCFSCVYLFHSGNFSSHFATKQLASITFNTFLI